MIGRPNKYRAKAVIVCDACDAWHGDGFLRWDGGCAACRALASTRFASRAEAARYGHLRTMERAGRISNLKLQTSFPVEINGVLVFTYRCDFDYVEADRRRIEDVKGKATALFRVKQKAVEAAYPGIKIEVVRV